MRTLDFIVGAIVVYLSVVCAPCTASGSLSPTPSLTLMSRIEGGVGICDGVSTLSDYGYEEDCTYPIADAGQDITGAIQQRYFSLEAWLTSPADEDCNPLLNLDDRYVIELVDDRTVRVVLDGDSVVFSSFPDAIFPGVLFISFHRHYWTASTLSTNCSIWYTNTVSKTVAPIVFNDLSNTKSRFSRVVLDYPQMPPLRITSTRCLVIDAGEIPFEVNSTFGNTTTQSVVSPPSWPYLFPNVNKTFTVKAPGVYCKAGEDEATPVVLESTLCSEIPKTILIDACILEPPSIVSRNITLSPPMHYGENRTILLGFSTYRYDKPLVIDGSFQFDYGKVVPGECEDGNTNWASEPIDYPYTVCYRSNINTPPDNAGVVIPVHFKVDGNIPIQLNIPLRSHFQAINQTKTLVENATVSFTLQAVSWTNSPALFHYRVTRLPAHGTVSFTSRGPSIRENQLVLSNTLYYTPDLYFSKNDTGMQYIIESCGGIFTDPATVQFDVTGVFSGMMVQGNALAPVRVVTSAAGSTVRLQVSECITFTDLDDNDYMHYVEVTASRGMMYSSLICPNGCRSFSYNGTIENITRIMANTELNIGNLFYIPDLDGIRFVIQNEDTVYCRLAASDDGDSTELVNGDHALSGDVIPIVVISIGFSIFGVILLGVIVMQSSVLTSIGSGASSVFVRMGLKTPPEPTTEGGGVSDIAMKAANTAWKHRGKLVVAANMTANAVSAANAYRRKKMAPKNVVPGEREDAESSSSSSHSGGASLKGNASRIAWGKRTNIKSSS